MLLDEFCLKTSGYFEFLPTFGCWKFEIAFLSVFTFAWIPLTGFVVFGRVLLEFSPFIMIKLLLADISLRSGWLAVMRWFGRYGDCWSFSAKLFMCLFATAGRLKSFRSASLGFYCNVLI